jgi:hypothetical protein
MLAGRLIGAGALTVLLLAPPAAAESGVHVDPDSPAGVEYQLPLDRARDDASSRGGSRGHGSGGKTTSNGGGQGSGGAPLFGVGINSKGRRDTAGGRSDTAPGASGAEGGSAGGPADSQRSSRLASQAAVKGSGSATLRTLGVVFAILLGGALIGLLLRRGLGRARA